MALTFVTVLLCKVLGMMQNIDRILGKCPISLWGANNFGLKCKCCISIEDQREITMDFCMWEVLFRQSQTSNVTFHLLFLLII